MLAPDARRVTVEAAAEAFLAHQDQRRRDGRIGESFRVNMDQLLRKHVLPAIGNAKLAEVNLPMLTKWHAGMTRGTKVGPVTARIVTRMLGNVFEFAMRREWMHRNPALLLLGELRGIKVQRVRTFSIVELKKVLHTANERRYRGCRPDAHLRMLCVVHLASFCGLRVGEIFGLHSDHVDFERGVIVVQKSLSRHEGLKTTKSAAGIREIAMPAHVAALLSAWIADYMTPAAQGAMFRSANGKSISMDGFRQSCWGALLERAGFPRIGNRPAFHIHAMRHFAASWMIDAGWSLPEVAKTLGHAKVDVTLSVYAHALSHKSASQPQMQALADRLLTSAIAA
jgi:integrase